MEGRDDRARGAAPEHGRDGEQAASAGEGRRASGRREEIRRLKGEISRKREERAGLMRGVHQSRRSGDRRERQRYLALQKSNKQEIFVLQQRLRAAREEAEPVAGALPDFAIIGAPKCGTTFLYHLLARHPLVRPAAFKEPHYFSTLFEKGADWYRGCFPPPRREDGGRTITGEASPSYLYHPQAPRRMAGVVPEARLIALLRNPVDRLYSGFHFFGARRGRDTTGFEAHAEAALADPRRKELSRGVYVDQLLRWSEFFDGEQMLVIKSEDFFENQRRTFETVMGFLGLPAWEPEASDLGQKRNKGPYERGIDGETRRRLEEFYEPHNQRLYDHLGVDFGW